MNAKILPLIGKYYGTEIEYGDGHRITVWNHDSFEPSDRQLKYWGITREDLKKEENFDLRCDSHYETETDYKVALVIVNALKGLGEQ